MTTSPDNKTPQSGKSGPTRSSTAVAEQTEPVAATRPGTEAARKDISASNRRGGLVLTITAILLVIFAIVAMGIGQLGISPAEVLTIIYRELGAKLGLSTSHIEVDQAEVVAITQIRAPRVLLSILLGGALAVSGAVLQALFRNPLVSPDIVGVSSGASFGGVLAILLGTSSLLLMGSSFLFGLAAVLIVMLIGRIRTNSPTLTIVLAGVVVAAFFSAMVSLITYVADPYEKLPSINFWLMGSFASATWSKLGVAIIPVVVGVIVVHALRWRINVLSLGDEDARALGLNPSTMRWILILTVALLTAASVSAAGEVGWVGLVIPHLVRILVGHDNRIVLPGSFLVGGLYLLLIDTIARTATTVEIPIGILTASIGAPVFIFLLIQRSRKGQSFA